MTPAVAVTPERVMAAVEAVMLQPFAWGPCDCCSAACQVFARLWGIDPMAPWHGYHGPLQAARLLRAHGGLEALAGTAAARAGLRPGHATGGLAITQPAARHRALLICITPGLWAGKSTSGFAILRAAGKGWHA